MSTSRGPIGHVGELYNVERGLRLRLRDCKMQVWPGHIVEAGRKWRVRTGKPQLQEPRLVSLRRIEATSGVSFFYHFLSGSVAL